MIKIGDFVLHEHRRYGKVIDVLENMDNGQRHLMIRFIDTDLWQVLPENLFSYKDKVSRETFFEVIESRIKTMDKMKEAFLSVDKFNELKGW